ncbi:MAG: response regulator transcription factor [Myxococcota bacterium]
MWILVVGPESQVGAAEHAVAVLGSLGCRVRSVDLWDSFEFDDEPRPPAAALIEALEEVDAARAALMRLRSVERFAQTPALIATSVSGLTRLQPDDGFDDVVLHPYVPAELYLRLRRAEWRASEFRGGRHLKTGELSIDLDAHEVRYRGALVALTQQEFALLAFLAQRRGRVFSRDQLLNQVWGVDYYGGSRTVDIHVRRLRMKLGDGAEDLQTVRGVGYKMRSAP